MENLQEPHSIIQQAVLGPISIPARYHYREIVNSNSTN